VLGVTLLLAQSVSAWAKSYTVEDLHIEAQVFTDGALRIRETIRYEFKGSFSFAFREIPLKTGERLASIQVSEGSNQFVESEESEPGFFEVSSAKDRTKITWRFKARDEGRTFNIAYTVHGAVRRYPDVIELYYKFVGEEWEKSIHNVSVLVRFTDDVPVDSIRAWAHGPLHGTVELPGDGTVLLNVAPLPKKTFWEGRILFSESALTGVPLYSEEPAREGILAEEAAWAEEANRRREEEMRKAARRAELKEQWLPVVLLSAFLGVAFWSFLFIRFGKPHPVKQSHVPGQVPSSHPPALTSYLLNRSIGGAALVTTLVDLARRGYLKISEKVSEKSGWLRTSKETDYRFELTGQSMEALQGFESELLEFIMVKAGDLNGFWLSRFKKVSKKNRSEFLKWFKSWQKKLEKLAKEEKFFEPYRLGVLLPNILCGLVLITIGLVFNIVTQSLGGTLPLIVGALQAILSAVLTRRTERGKRLFEAWKAYKKHLKSISRARGPVSLTSQEWGNYIVAAILLGLHEKLAKVMEMSVGAESAKFFPWFAMSPESGGGGGMVGLGNGISSLVTSVSSAMSSASGMGGGASGGGGGGSGGGGGGAG